LDIVKVDIMHVISRSTVAVAVTLATIIVCVFGIRAELHQAKQLAPARAHEMRSDTDAGPALARDNQ
jgi:hypothetical protein